MNKIDMFTLTLGILAGATLTTMTLGHNDHDTHPIGYADSTYEVHVHSDFVVFLNGNQYDLTDDKYQSKGDQVRHADIHLHDNNDEVIHRHDHGVTLAEFFASIGFTLTNSTVTDDKKTTFKNNDEKELLVFVNDERIEEPATYINQEEDKILIYYGNPNDGDKIRELLLSVTDRACIYSGTCPERGVAPPESCGLTCEL